MVKYGDRGGRQPFSADQARVYLRHCLEHGGVIYVEHVMNRMAKRDLTMPEIVNALKAGAVSEAEAEGNAWRHHVSTPRVVVVVEFNSETEVVVVTAWRLRA